ncbi:MAG: hypothetical protein FWC53_00910 [Firmicutes bacterium]|nr:hypothetical protein [Bacillota bacterium]
MKKILTSGIILSLLLCIILPANAVSDKNAVAEQVAAPPAPVTNVNKNTGIKLDATDSQVPAGATLVAEKITSGTAFDNVKAALSGIKNYTAFNISLTSDGTSVQPNGNVKISIPVPSELNTSNLSVYRIDAANVVITYPATIATVDGIKYASFETDHFSTYVLGDALTPADASSNAENPATNTTHKTGTAWYIYAAAGVIIISIIGIAIFSRSRNQNK